MGTRWRLKHYEVMADFHTPVEDIPGIVADQHALFRTGVSKDLEWRRRQIAAVKRMVQEHEDEFKLALVKDLKATKWWVDNAELAGTLSECDVALKQLKSWAAPRKQSTPPVLLPGSSYVHPEPMGVVLIVAPFNYPQNLLLMPLVSALAAGNVAVVKPSEVSEHSARVLGKYLPKYLPEAAAVVQGAIPETQALLREKYDLIIYTGSGAVAKHYLRAAAEHLTPCLLELGGKCPAIVAPDADIKQAAKKILWAKYTLNFGQSCLSPDYVLCDHDTEAALLAALKETLVEFFGENPQTSPELSRMINERHTERVAGLLRADDLDVVVGGSDTVDISDRYIAPTIVRIDGPEEAADVRIMQEEIFGPVLPVVRVDSVDAAVEMVNDGDKPLGLYVFTKSSSLAKDVLSRTSSGGAVVNDAAIHHSNSGLPFGGVGGSGMGSYHGKWGFDQCSHMKAVMYKYGTDPSLRFPPYSEGDLKIFKLLRRVDMDILKRGAIALGIAGCAAFAWWNGYVPDVSGLFGGGAGGAGSA